MIVVFAVSGGVAIGFYYLMFNLNLEITLVRTMLTTFLCMESLFLALSLRSFNKSIFRRDIFGNKWINRAVFISLAGLLAAIYFKPSAALELLPLPITAWAVILAANIIEILLIDRFKLKLLAR
jgi:magnesium-transporting ATPase (P-type)